MKLRSGLLVFIAVTQTIFFLAHYLLYETWALARFASATGLFWLKIVLAVLSVSFVAASLLAWRYTGILVRAVYKVAAVWLGLLSFLFLATIAFWLAFGASWLIGLDAGFLLSAKWIAAALFGAAAAAGIYGSLNSGWTRITRITVRLANLPETWRGRRAVLVSDLHLGHVRNGNFLRRIVAHVLREKPDAIFIAGDLYDGTAIDAKRAAEPLRELTAPQGVYFVAGNHEQFGDDTKYLRAVEAAGVRVLQNEKVDAAGLQIIGVPYRHATHGNHFASVLKQLDLDPSRASILLTHAPDHPQIAEAAGVSLQLSGHTHLGQFLPWSWLARRIYRQFVYGLSRIGKMQVFTSSGAGTWGPPLRLGSNPEIVLLQFEPATP